MLGKYSFRLAARRFIEDVLFDQIDWESPLTWDEWNRVCKV